MQRDVRRVKLGGNVAAAVMNSRQGCGSAAEAVKMQKWCLRVGGTWSCWIQWIMHMQKAENTQVSRWKSVSLVVLLCHPFHAKSCRSRATQKQKNLWIWNVGEISVADFQTQSALMPHLKKESGYLGSEACCQPWKWLKVPSAHSSPQK